MTAKKEAIMASVRNELAQLNAQQLMNVRSDLHLKVPLFMVAYISEQQ